MGLKLGSKVFVCIRRYPFRTALLFLVTAFLLLNVAAYLHAFAMLNFTTGRQRTPNPEHLSVPQKIKTLLTGVRIPKPVNRKTPKDYDLTFQTCRFEAKDKAELEAWYVPHENPKGTVVLIHGYATSKASVLPEARVFNEFGYASFIVDLRASGGSEGVRTSIGFHEARDAKTAVDFINSTYQQAPIVLYGKSMGGAAIFRSVYLGDVKPRAVIVEALFDRMLSTVQNRFGTMGLPSFPSANLLLFWGGWQCGLNGFEHNPAEYAEKVECPVLLMCGTVDPRVTVEQSVFLFSRLPGEKQLVNFPGAGHEDFLAADADLWKNSVSGFLATYVSP